MYRIISLKSTRASIQVGQNANTLLRLREVSSAITMVVMVGIYLLVDIPTVITLDILFIYNSLVPSAAGTGVIFTIAHFIQV